jgi:hypothetical protein
VDIATNESRQRIEECLDSIVRDCGIFLKWTKRQHKTKPWLPLASYFCFYRSHFVGENDAFIMLDAQLTRSPYATRMAPIRCGNLYGSPVQTEIPLASSIIGDKLLTLGPSTLGIPLGKGKDAQRLKHVFDVSLLLQNDPPLLEIRRSLLACVEHENKLQEKAITIPHLLQDTLAFCKSTLDYREIPTLVDSMTPVLIENIRGLTPFADHLFSKNYSWNMLTLDLARVGFCMAAVCNSGISNTEFKKALDASGNTITTYWKYIGEWM